MHAGVVQWLVYDLAKVEMGVRSSSLAPNRLERKEKNAIN